MASIGIDDLSDAIMEELHTYSKEISEDLKREVKQVAKECVKDIQRHAPEDTSDYKKGWKTKVAYENENDIRVTVYNAKKPQITHLLEHGHAKRNGGRVEGKCHIYQAQKNAEASLENKVKVIIR